MNLRQAALAIALVFSVPAAARAGWISANVQIDAQQTPGTPSPGPLTMTFLPSGILNLTPGVPFQIGTITLGQSFRWDQATDSYTAITNGDVKLTVTDEASHWTGTLDIPIAAVDLWTYRSWDGRWSDVQMLQLADAWGQNPASSSVELKGWQYTLTATPNADQSAATFTLTAAPMHTPEPGTFALGLAALLPVGVRALRRKK